MIANKEPERGGVSFEYHAAFGYHPTGVTVLNRFRAKTVGKAAARA